MISVTKLKSNILVKTSVKIETNVTETIDTVLETVYIISIKQEYK